MIEEKEYVHRGDDQSKESEKVDIKIQAEDTNSVESADFLM